MDIQELVRAQRAYFDTGATRPYAFRLLQLKKLQQALRDNEQLLERAMMQDFRKAPMEVYMCETGMVLEELRFHLKHLKGWMRERAVPTPLAQFPAKSFVSPEPYGVALIISPWNYPVQLCLSPLVGAISGGNCAVVKPSAYAPATSAAIAKLIRETFDARYIAAVEGGRAENSALLAQRFDTIFFTGSVAVGKVVMEAAAKNLTPVTLELGGKSPVARRRPVVRKDADPVKTLEIEPLPGARGVGHGACGVVMLGDLGGHLLQQVHHGGNDLAVLGVCVKIHASHQAADVGGLCIQIHSHSQNPP